jgi:hemolysin activation/secretion protein
MPHTSPPFKTRIASAVTCAAMVVPSAVLAQSAVDPAPAAPTLRGVLLLGQLPLPPSVVQAAIAHLIDQPINEPLLAQVRQAVTKTFDNAGLGLVRVDQPSMQGATALVPVQVLTIGEIKVLRVPDAASILEHSDFPELQIGRTPNLQQLDRQIRLANLRSKRRVEINFQPSVRNAIDARIQESGGDELYGRVQIDNAGQAETGRERLRLQLGHADALGPGRSLDVSTLVSATAPERQQQWAVHYQHPVPSWATLFSVDVTDSRSRPGVVAGFFDVSGNASTVALTARHLLTRTGTWEPYIEASLEPALYDDVVDFFGVNLGNKVGAAPLALAWGVSVQDGAWTANGQLRLRHNPGWGPQATDANYSAARFGATPHWGKLDLGLEARRNLGGGHDASLRLQAQWSQNALIAPQRFGVGGSAMLRGLQEGELSGDSGVAISLEYGWIPAPGHRIATFMDMGWVQRHMPRAGETSDGDASALGVSWQWALPQGLQLSASVASVIGATNLPVSKVDDARLHIAMNWSF